MLRSSLVLLALAALLTASARAEGDIAPAKTGKEAAYRTWLVEVGKQAISAELLGVEKGQVALRRRDGNVVSVPLAHLSKYDQKPSNTTKSWRAQRLTFPSSASRMQTWV